MTYDDSDKIREAREKLDAVAGNLRLELEHVSIELRYLQQKCPHPDAYRRSVMGREIEERCPDCGWIR